MAKPRTTVDPELRRQLDRAADHTPARVEAVIRLREPVRRSARAKSAERSVAALAHELLARVAGEVGADDAAYDFNVFPNLGYVVVSASAGYVECVLRQPEVASASANRRNG